MNEQNLIVLISHYQTNIHPQFSQHLSFYEHLPTIDMSIEYAALAKLPSGKRHPHQYRLKRTVLESVRQHLQANAHQLEQSNSFEDVIHIVRGCAVPGFGPLAMYDTALRLAVRLGKRPTAVYLHAGTRKGAAALGLNVDRAMIPMDELPGPLQRIGAEHVENFLCIYKDQLSTFTLSDNLKNRTCVPIREAPQPVSSPCS
ncbi:MAG: hypothetical protein EI684_14155 [Candidatus Viridilinea halotolerans]|uniref:Uncharacterized protein n=1 Tax=Candidatus Viridilinea halotolerans TaxID=2491704 RepID=A0A426TWM4_9CHLR|nr:MAG: hypothetical protein EI684_14155 [Candidatus Viridilinea halotolerans]